MFDEMPVIFPKGLYRFHWDARTIEILDRTGRPIITAAQTSDVRNPFARAIWQEIRGPQGIQWRYVSQQGYGEGEKRNIGLYDENWRESAFFQLHKNISFPSTKHWRFYYKISVETTGHAFHFFVTGGCADHFMVSDERFRRVFHISCDNRTCTISDGTVHVAQELSFRLMSLLIPLAIQFRYDLRHEDVPIWSRIQSS